MNRSILLVAAATLVGLAAWVGVSRAQSTRQAPGYTHLAVCDIASVFNKYQRAADLTTDFNGRKERVKAEDDDKAKQFDQQAAMVKELAPGSKRFDEEMEKLQRMDIERQVWRKMQEQTVMRDYRMATEQMYNDIGNTIAAIAKEQGIDVVLYRDSIDLSSDTPTELLGKIALRKVLYNDPSIDITDQVIERVNATYSQGSKK